MSELDETPERDPKLDELLGDVRGEPGPPPEQLDAMFASLSKDIQEAERKPSFWLKSRSTAMRRAIAIASTLGVLAVGTALLMQTDRSLFSPLRVVLALGALGILLGVSVHQALRPLHAPPAPAWTRGLVAALTVAATFALALLPTAEGHTGGVLDHLVSPCTFIGLLIGLPVYAVLRLLDRTGGAALAGACAAALAGNLVLEMHCPHADSVHLMASHFSVALVFVAGLGLLHLLLARLRR
ncbi:MAG: hypothetical protein IT378_01690 [Sandaracinaceae bacterium]|nr:hypothetical protein [Sandaracinaceae bacterium]